MFEIHALGGCMWGVVTVELGQQFGYIPTGRVHQPECSPWWTPIEPLVLGRIRQQVGGIAEE